MNYRSTKETAELWNISQRRITILASSGRIPGAKLVGKTWLIPEDAVKPDDARYKKGNSNEDEYFFPLSVFVYDSLESAEKKLSKNQLDLFKAQKLCISCNFKEADVLLTKLLNTSDNIYITLGALYFKIFTDIFLNNKDSLYTVIKKIQTIDLAHIKNSEEIALILLDIKGILSGNTVYLNNYKLNRNYNYSNESLPYLILMETYTSLITAYTSGKQLNPVFKESAFIFMKKNKSVYSEITLHIYFAMIYKTNNDNENYLFHIEEALQLAEKYESILPFIIGYKFLHSEIINFIKNNDSLVIKRIPEIAQRFHINSEKFLESNNITKIYYSLSPEEIILIENARAGLTNKEIAKLTNISESYVSKKYFELCKKTGVSSKRELVDFFIQNMKI